MNSAIIVAAGSGTRFGTGQPKQFLEILGKPLIVHTLEIFESCAAVDEIILVLPDSHIEFFSAVVAEYSLKKLVKTIAGGTNRAASVRNGLDAVKAETAQVVAVHDGARPLVTVEEVTRTIEKAVETGAACLVAPVTDTIKQVRGGKIVQTVDRADLRRALTPQAFRFEILKRVFAESERLDAATDECSLAENLGIEVSTLEGGAQNIKITSPADWFLAEMLLRKTKND